MIDFNNRYVKQLIALADLLVDTEELTQWGGHCGVDALVDKFERRAKRLGYEKLGAGFFAQVWTHPKISKYAIKLGFKKEDSGAAYAAYCRANQGKVGIPTIYGINRTHSCYIVLMDKYYSYQKLASLYFSKRDYFIKKKTKTPLIRPYLLNMFDKVQGVFYPNPFDIGRTSSNKLIETAQDIKEYFEGIAKFDLHEGNVMVDKFGHLVITDPVSFCKSEKKEHRERKLGAPLFLTKISRLPLPSVENMHELRLHINKLAEANRRYKAGFIGMKKPDFLLKRDMKQGINHRRHNPCRA